MGDVVQARVEDQGLIVPLIRQLEESPIRVHCVSEVRPKRKVLRRKQGLSGDRAQSAASVERNQVVAENSSNYAREKSSGGQGYSSEGKDGQRESSRGLIELFLTMKATKPRTAPPVTLRCSRFLLSAWILWRLLSSR
jgi:hypothetical protein